MEGTLYFAYNIREDDDSYACIATIATQSAQHGPFFRLILPHLNTKHKSAHSKAQRHPHAFAPRIDEYQPQIFPELPIRGQNIHLECFAYAFPIPTYRWTRVDGLPLPVGRHKLLSFGRILRIDAAELTDSGRYRCTVQNELGTASAELRLVIQALPVLFHPLIDQLVAPNSTASLHCQISDSGGSVQVEWFRNGSPLSPLLLNEQERKRFLIAGNELTIANASPSDSGIFQCIVSNDIGSVSSSALLFVTELAPRFHANVFLSKIFVVEGTHLSIPCLFQSNPPAKAQWKKLFDASETEGSELNNFIDQSVPGQEIALLNIQNAQALDSGLYECIAINGLGKASAIMRLEVIPRPQMSIQIEESNENQSSKKFTCELEIACRSVEDCPEALFSWEFNNKPIQSLAFGNGHQQTIRMGQRGNTFNEVENGKINKLVKQQSQLELPTKFTKENFGRFACNSLFGVATVEIEPSLVFVPLKLSVGGVHDGSVKLLYRIIQPIQTSNVKRRGSDGRYREKPIEKIYQLEARTALERYWRPIRRVELDEDAISSNGGVEREILLEKLEPNQLYQFRLRPSTERVQYVTLSDWVKTPEAVPSQVVQNLRFRMLDDQHLLLEWDPIERVYLSAPQLRYNVSWTLPDGQQFTESTTNPRHVIILPSNLKNNSKECLILIVSVRPFNQMGPGKIATSKVVRASDKKPQRFAVNLRLFTVNSTHLNISWHWEGMDPCENVLGAKIICTEEGDNLDIIGNIREKKGDKQSKFPNYSNSLHQVSQSVPSVYNFWLFGGLLPERNYFCKILPFDQYGRFGPERIESFGRGRTAERAPDKAPEISFVLVKEVDDLDSEIDKGTTTVTKRGYALLLDWRPVPLTLTTINESYSAKDDSSLTSKIGSEIRKSEETNGRQRGYNIFVYVTETAEQPIELTLSEAELHEPQRPSARIDGLKPMFYYSIQIAAFNRGGIGPLSDKIPVRVGLHSQQQLNQNYFSGCVAASGNNRYFFNILFVFLYLVICYSIERRLF
uniref:Ig-like domain-containing protein n=1 Tax=Meloidogyne hapla TaxID=6305 RepID=A0A1I8BHF8_MELHA